MPEYVANGAFITYKPGEEKPVGQRTWYEIDDPKYWDWDAPIESLNEKPKTSFAQGVWSNIVIDNAFYNAYKAGERQYAKDYGDWDATPVRPEEISDFLLQPGNEKYINGGYAPKFFDQVRDKGDLVSISNQIDNELKNRELLANQSTTQSLFTSLVSLGADPTILLPGGAVYKSVKFASTIAKTAASATAYTAGAMTLNEVILQNTQQTRTVNESVANVLVSSALGGAIGAGIGAFTSRGAQRELLTALHGDAEAVLNGRTKRVQINEDGTFEIKMSPSADPEIPLNKDQLLAKQEAIESLEKIANEDLTVPLTKEQITQATNILKQLDTKTLDLLRRECTE